MFRQVGAQSELDLRRAELIVFPVLLILLLIVFRSVIAALLPLFIGVFAVIGTLLVLRIVSSFTEVSIFSLNLASVMGSASAGLLQRYRKQGVAGLVSKHGGRKSNNQLSAEVKKKALDLLKSKYQGFGHTLAHEKLVEKISSRSQLQMVKTNL